MTDLSSLLTFSSCTYIGPRLNVPGAQLKAYPQWPQVHTNAPCNARSKFWEA